MYNRNTTLCPRRARRSGGIDLGLRIHPVVRNLRTLEMSSQLASLWGRRLRTLPFQRKVAMFGLRCAASGIAVVLLSPGASNSCRI